MVSVPGNFNRDSHTVLTHRPSSSSPSSFIPILSPFGVFQAHLSAGTQSPCSASLSCREGPGNTYVPPKSLTRGLWCLRRNLRRKTLHTMHRGSLRCVVIEFYKQQSVFNHVCSFGTSGQQQHHRPTRKAGSQLWGWTCWMHLASTVGTAGLPQSVCMNHRTQLCGGTVYSRDSSINTCCRRNAHSLQNPPLLQPLWRVEPTSLCTFPVPPGLVSKDKTSAGAVPAGPGSKSSTGK